MRLFLKFMSIAALSAANLVSVHPAMAWSAGGHRLIGKLAYDLLTPHAKREFARLVPNYSMEKIAVWADCAKEVSHSAAKGYRYLPGKMSAAECRTIFKDDADETANLISYEKRNWNDCVVRSTNDHRGCAPQFHFLNIPVDGPGYVATDSAPYPVGEDPYDAVHAVKAAIAKLQHPDQAAPAPFDLTEADALKILVHLIGDIYQPLHMGCVFLDREGQTVAFTRLTPDNEEMYSNAGGNALALGSANLHHIWDTISFTSTDVPAVSHQGNDPSKWIDAYAASSVIAAKDTFDGLTYGRFQAKTWSVNVPAGVDYTAKVGAVQRARIGMAATSVAEVLNAIWPGQ